MSSDRANQYAATADVLVVGLRGLGAEIAKNLILAGIPSLALFDPEPATLQDLGSQFLLRDADIGLPRAAASLPQLAALNPHVKLRDLGGAPGDEITVYIVKEFQIVVLTDTRLATQLEISAWTHANSVPFVSAETRGLCGSIFVDFGAEYAFFEGPHNRPRSGKITEVTPNSDGRSKCTCEVEHGLSDGNYVRFPDRPTEPARRIAVLDEHTFVVDGPIEAKAFERVNMPEVVEFKSLEESLEVPTFVIVDPEKGERRAAALHAGFRALHEFSAQNGHLPDATEAVSIAQAYNADCDPSVIAALASQASGELAPTNAVIGALAAQEVLKALSRTRRPIVQHLCFDALEALPSARPTDRASSEESRYAGQIAVFGDEFQRNLARHKQLLVGASAVGQEVLRLYAMMGLGGVHVADYWSVGRDDIRVLGAEAGENRSVAAARAIVEMCPQMEGRVVANAERFGDHTDPVFTEGFFADIDGVTTALEDRGQGLAAALRCVDLRKPLLVARVGRAQAVVPHVTDSFEHGQWPSKRRRELPGQPSAFPYSTEQTVDWARQLFHRAFAEPFDAVLPRSFEDCVRWARLQFEEHFRDGVAQLVAECPPDTKTADGRPFFAGPRRAPVPLSFDAENALHLDFIVAAAIIHASAYGIAGSDDRAVIQALAQAVDVGANGKGESEHNESDLREPNGAKLDLENDAIFHLDFVSAAANIRAVCFGIPTVARWVVKRFLTGKFPEIITPTALAAGLACLELYKIIDGKAALPFYRDSFVDLESPSSSLSLSEPAAPEKHKLGDTEWTLWDCFDFPSDITLREVIQWFKNEHGLIVTLVFRGINILWQAYLPDLRREKRLAMKMFDLVEAATKKPLRPHVRSLYLNVIAEDENGDIVDVPPIVVRI